MNRFTQTKVHTGGVRPVSLLLMVIFTVCAFALMWAAVGCLDRISESSSDAVDGLAAAHCQPYPQRRGGYNRLCGQQWEF